MDSAPQDAKKAKSAPRKRQRLVQEGGNQTLWLVRLPVDLAREWNSARHDEVLGSLNIRPSAENKTGKQLEVVTEGGRGVFVMDDLSAANTQENLFAFSENDKAGFALNGKITKRLVLRPKDDSRARVLSGPALLTKSRLLSASELHSKQQQNRILPTPSIDAASAGASISSSSAAASASATAAAAVDKSAVMEEVLAAFHSAQQALSLHELYLRCKAKHAGLAESDLRDILKRYANYHQRGTQKGLWELRPEFKTQS